MDLFDQSRGRPSPKRGIQLQGPRPSPLKVSKDSHKLKKPSLPPQSQKCVERRPPVIIYTVSPKIIHTKPSEFMSLVQRLTGCASSSASANPDAAACDGPAPERTSPTTNKPSKDDETDDLRRLVISSAPPQSSMHPISPNFFSPSVVDINQLNFFHELNVPPLHGSKGIMDAAGGFMTTTGNFFFSL